VEILEIRGFEGNGTATTDFTEEHGSQRHSVAILELRGLEGTGTATTDFTEEHGGYNPWKSWNSVVLRETEKQPRIPRRDTEATIRGNPGTPWFRGERESNHGFHGGTRMSKTLRGNPGNPWS